MTKSIFHVLGVFCLAASVSGGTMTVDKWTVTTPDTPDASLPNVLCIGDSILGGYGAQLRPLLDGKANVYTWNMAFFATPGERGIPVDAVNAVGALADFSAVVFNNGLHSYNWDVGAVSDADVAASYATLADALAAANPRARLFYLATTPHTGDKNASGVVTDYGAYNDVMKRLNRHARAVMVEKGVPFLDAYSLLAPRLSLAAGDHFHWQKEGYVRLARFVATALGHYEPEEPALADVSSGISNLDGCIYAHTTHSGRGYFDKIELYAGLSTGPAIYSGFLFPALPGTLFTKATLHLPVAVSRASAANLDVWGMGWTASPAQPNPQADIWSDVDTTTWYNGRAPLKIKDNLLPAGTAASGVLTCDATTFAALCINRAGTTNAHAIVRINPDATPTDVTMFADLDKHAGNPSRFVYTVPVDPIASPLREFAETAPSVGYRADEVAWVQYADADGTGYDYPAVLGRVNGRDRNLILRVPLSVSQQLSDATLNLVVTPTGAAKMAIPEGVNIDVWALGVQDIAENEDPALPVNPFLAGTTDVRTLLGGAPVRLGTIAVGGSVLLPGQTLGGGASFRTALTDWVNGVIASETASTTGTRYLVLRVNATAATPSVAGDWSFGIGSVATPGFASMLEMTFRPEASMLPEAVDRVITLNANTTYTFTEATDFGDVTNIVTQTGTEVVFSISEGETKSLAASIVGPGTIFKMGAGELAFTSSWRLGYNVGGGLRVEEGALRLPEFSSAVELELKSVHVAEGATLYLAGSDSVVHIRTRFTNLSGAGLVTNAWSQTQVIQQDQNTTSPAFAGTIGGKISNFWIYPSARINLTGTNSSCTITGGLPGFGTLGVAKFGYDKNENSSVGRATAFDIGPNTRNGSGALVYLGSTGETTTKDIYFRPWANNGGTCILDAGEGGLVWNGNWICNKSAAIQVVLQGDGFATNEMGGAFTDTTVGSGSTHLEKRGAGTWFLRPTSSTHRGVTSVKEGKLLFETLREKGEDCSLGRSSRTYASHWAPTEPDASKAVPYAFSLGGGAKGEATLECVGKAGSSLANAATERPLVLAGDGRLATTCAQPFSLKGVSSIAAQAVTLSLDGTNGASQLDTVEDGASALSVAKDGPGTWTLSGPLTFSGALAVNAGTLEIRGLDTQYSWYKYVMKTLNSYYSNRSSDNGDTCRVTREFALYDAEGVRRNVNLTISRAEAVDLQPGEATVVETAVRNYSNGSWAFTNPTYYLQNMFDDNGNTSNFLAGRNNGTTADTWVSVAMRLPVGTPPIVACDVYGNTGAWNTGTRRTVAYSVMGSYDGISWTELTNQTTNDTSRFTSGWYSDGTPFVSGEVRKLSEGHGIAIPSSYPVAEGVSQLQNVSSVRVAAGATLRASGTVELKNLDAAVDEDGRPVAGGTIEGFTVASSGELRLSGAVASGTELPYTFVNMKGLENFRAWTVYEGAGAVSKKRVSIRGGNRLALTSGGLTLVFR